MRENPSVKLSQGQPESLRSSRCIPCWARSSPAVRDTVQPSEEATKVKQVLRSCDHIHTHAHAEPTDNHACHRSFCKRVTSPPATHVVFFRHGDVDIDNLDGLNRQPLNDQNPDGPLELCICATCGKPIMLDDKERRTGVIVSHLIGHDAASLPATCHALYDPATDVPRSTDSQPAHEGLRPDFVRPDLASRAPVGRSIDKHRAPHTV